MHPEWTFIHLDVGLENQADPSPWNLERGKDHHFEDVPDSSEREALALLQAFMNHVLELLLLDAEGEDDRLVLLQVDPAVMSNHLPNSHPVLCCFLLRRFGLRPSFASLAASIASTLLAT